MFVLGFKGELAVWVKSSEGGLPFLWFVLLDKSAGISFFESFFYSTYYFYCGTLELSGCCELPPLNPKPVKNDRRSNPLSCCFEFSSFLLSEELYFSAAGFLRELLLMLMMAELVVWSSL